MVSVRLVSSGPNPERVAQMLLTRQVADDADTALAMVQDEGKVLCAYEADEQGAAEDLVSQLTKLGAAAQLELDPTLDPDLLPFSDGELWDEERVVRRILHHQELMVLSAFQIGKDLICTKAHLGHGGFVDFVERRMPFNMRTAQSYMKLARTLVKHPGLVKPLANAGIRKAVLLTTLAPDQLEEVVEEGKVGEAPIEGIEEVPYAELKRQVDKLKARTADLEEQVGQKDHELTKAKTALADASGGLQEGDEEIVVAVATFKAEFTEAVRRMRLRLHPACLRADREELPANVRAEIVGALEYAQVLLVSESLQTRIRIGEQDLSLDLLQVVQEPRVLAEKNEIPADLAPTANKPNLRVAAERR